jgi:hypothetical protein
MITNIILSFVGVFAVTYGIMAYISGIVVAVVKKSKFSQLKGLFCVGMISLGMSILLTM